MRIESTDERERRFKHLCEATGESAKSKAIDQAAKYYLRMAGGTPAVPNGKIAELLELAEDQGTVTVEEIADVLDAEELSVTAETHWSVE